MGCAETGRLQTLDLDFSAISPSPLTSNDVELALSPLDVVTGLVSDQAIDSLTTHLGYHRFTGTGHDEHQKPFVCAGIIHDVPDLVTTTSIPGCKRITFVQRCNTSPLDLNRQEYFEHPLDEDCWTLEGLIVPGGHMMLGKYTNMMDMHGQDMLEVGPFLFWKDWS